jgi:hypothetical protein
MPKVNKPAARKPPPKAKVKPKAIQPTGKLWPRRTGCTYCDYLLTVYVDRPAAEARKLCQRCNPLYESVFVGGVKVDDRAARMDRELAENQRRLPEILAEHAHQQQAAIPQAPAIVPEPPKPKKKSLFGF